MDKLKLFYVDVPKKNLTCKCGAKIPQNRREFKVITRLGHGKYPTNYAYICPICLMIQIQNLTEEFRKCVKKVYFPKLYGVE